MQGVKQSWVLFGISGDWFAVVALPYGPFAVGPLHGMADPYLMVMVISADATDRLYEMDGPSAHDPY